MTTSIWTAEYNQRPVHWAQHEFHDVCSFGGRQHPARGLAGLELVDDIGLGLEAAAADDLARRVGVAQERLGGPFDRQTTGRNDSEKTCLDHQSMHCQLYLNHPAYS